MYRRGFMDMPFLAFIMIFLLGVGLIAAIFLAGGQATGSPPSFNVTTVDSCQYIEVGIRHTDSYAITHKGNCTNCIARSR